MLYTDGLTEAKRDAIRGEQHLLNAAVRALKAAPGQEAAAIYRDLVSGGAHDDIALLFIRLHPVATSFPNTEQPRPLRPTVAP